MWALPEHTFINFSIVRFGELANKKEKEREKKSECLTWNQFLCFRGVCVCVCVCVCALCMQRLLKGQFSQKLKHCHHLLTLIDWLSSMEHKKTKGIFMLLFCHTMKVDGGHGCQTSKSDKKARNTLTNCQRFIVLKKTDQMQMLLVEDSSSTVAKIHFSAAHCQKPTTALITVIKVRPCAYITFFICNVLNV